MLNTTKALKVFIYSQPELYSQLSAYLLRKYLKNSCEYSIELMTNLDHTITILPDLVILVGTNVNFFSSICSFYSGKVKILYIDPAILPNNKEDIEVNVDAVVCTNLKIKDQYISKGIKSNRIFVCGSPIFDEIKRLNVYDFNSNENVDIFFNLNFDLPGLEEEQIVSLAEFSSNTSNRVYCNVVDIKKGFQYIKKFSTLNTWRTIKEALYLKRLHIVEPYPMDILDVLKTTTFTVSGLSDTLIYSVLLSQPTLLIGEATKELGLHSYKLYNKNVDNLDFSITEDQVTFYLLNFLPCVFDNNNMKRILSIIQQCSYSILALQDFDNNLMDKFSEANSQLIDPLHFIKLQALNETNSNKIF